MIKFQSIAYFRSRLEALLKVRKGVYATVVDEIKREFGGKPIEQIRINNDMVLIDGPKIVIKLRLPDKQHRLAKKDGYRLLYLVYKDCDEVGFLDIYPKNGPMQQLDESDEVIAALLEQYASEKETGLLEDFEI